MTECTACGDKPKHTAKGFPKAVVEIINPEQLVLLRRVDIPASMGTEEDVPAAIGKYRNVLLVYEANEHIYLYSSDGIPTLLSTDIGDLEHIEEAIRELQGDVETLSSSLSAEVEARTTADATLEAGLAEEAGVRSAADMALGARIDAVAGDLATETALRTSADNTLQTNITAEATARADADAALGTRIDSVATNLATEVTNRTNADTTINGRIDTLVADLTTETNARQAADASLQGQIDGIEEKIPAQATAQNQLADKNFVNSSVATNTANFIGTFNSVAELEAYTGPVTNNDYAFVIVTDAQGNTAYDRYKYSGDTAQWIFEYELNNSSFTAVQWAAINSGITSGAVDKLAALADIKTIGSNLSLASNGTLSATDTTYTAGNGLSLAGTQFSADTSVLATQTDLTTGLATKQNTLTAGSNISISGSTISATDTTYSDFTGTDGTAAGAHGLVPAPATTDAGKVLGANGAWVTGGPAVVQTTGTSTTDVMSQNATTNMIYSAPANKRQICIGDGASTYDDDNYAIAIGKDARGGLNANYKAGDGVAIGRDASVSGQHGVAIGKHAMAVASPSSVAIGQDALANASGGNVVAVGASASAAGNYSVAVGAQAKIVSVSGQKGQIALGAYSYCGSTGEMNIGSTNTSYGYNSSNYRLLTGLYDPQSAHDAATKGYVDDNIPATFTTNEWNALWA